MTSKKDGKINVKAVSSLANKLGLPSLFLKRKFKWFSDIMRSPEHNLTRKAVENHPDAFRPFLGSYKWLDAIASIKYNRELWEEYIEKHTEYLCKKYGEYSISNTNLRE